MAVAAGTAGDARAYGGHVPLAWPHAVDPDLRGVGLEDLDLIPGEGTELGHALARYVRASGVGAFLNVVSTSFVSATSDEIVVDIVGRAARFTDADRTQRGRGLGVVRVAVPLADGAALCDFGTPRILFERALSDLHLRIAVSLGGELAILEDPSLGFRRVFPVGVGAIDRIRAKGRVASLTPSTEWGRVDKKDAYRALGSWFRGKPYIPLAVPFVWHGADGALHRAFGVTRVAFHAWQGRQLVRGFISHGCMTLRDADLDELSAFVQGTAGPLPTAIRAAERADAWHPYPHANDRFYRLKNFGSDEAPSYRVAGNLYVIERVVGAPLGDEELVDIYMDPEARARTELVVAGLRAPMLLP